MGDFYEAFAQPWTHVPEAARRYNEALAREGQQPGTVALGSFGSPVEVDAYEALVRDPSASLRRLADRAARALAPGLYGYLTERAPPPPPPNADLYSPGKMPIDRDPQLEGAWGDVANITSNFVGPGGTAKAAATGGMKWPAMALQPGRLPPKLPMDRGSRLAHADGTIEATPAAAVAKLPIEDAPGLPMRRVGDRIFAAPETKPRDIFSDYPRDKYPFGPPVDAKGALTHTPEGVELTAGREGGYIAGRRTEHGGNEGLTLEQIKDLIARLKGRRGDLELLPSKEMKDSWGYYTREWTPDGWKRTIRIVDDLKPDEALRVLAHEFAHLLSDRVGQASRRYLGSEGTLYRVSHDSLNLQRPDQARLMHELRRVYHEVNLPPELRKDAAMMGAWTNPEARIKPPKPTDSLRAQEVKMWTEAIGRYLIDPNYIKTVAPKVAEEIRRTFNGHRWLRNHLQFSAKERTTSLG